MKISNEQLKKWNPCKSGYDFYVKNNFEKIDLDDYEVVQDYNGYYHWLQNELKIERKYDSKGNCIWKKTPSGDIYEWEYDSQGNKIWEKDPDGDIWEFKYDSQGNMVQKKFSDRYIEEWKYDSKGNLIWEKDYFGRIYEYRYIYNSDGVLLKIIAITNNNEVLFEIKKKEDKE